MATTISAAFDQLLGWPSAIPRETQAAKDQRSNIEENLRGKFGLVSFFRAGSFENGTYVVGSNLDCFAVIPEASPRPNSHQLLLNVAAALRARFPNTGVRVDSPAVILPFGQDPSESTKVIPALKLGSTNLGLQQFMVPDGAGDWMVTSPDACNEYVRAIDEAHGGKAKSLIRLLKGWKHLRNVPISSHYLELMAAEYAKTQEMIIYDIDLRNIFEKILETGLAPYPEPRMPGERLTPCRTVSQRTDVLSRVRNAAMWSRDAVTLNFGGNTPEAFLRWDRILGRFLAFG